MDTAAGTEGEKESREEEEEKEFELTSERRDVEEEEGEVELVEDLFAPASPPPLPIPDLVNLI